MLRRISLGLALVTIACAYFFVPPKRTPGPALRDFEAYYAAGVTWHYSGDPYSRDVWRTEKDVPGVIATRDEFLPFVGPPFGLPFWSVLGRLPFGAAVALWGALLALAFAAFALGSARLGGLRLGTLATLGVLAFAACFGPLTSALALGQVALLSCAAIVVVPLLRGRRATLPVALAALIAALQPNLAIVLAARLANARTWIAFGCAALVAAGTSALALGGPAGLLHYFDVLRAHGAAERFIAIQTTPGAVARALGASARVAAMFGLACAAGVTLALALQFASRRYSADARLALACAALPLVLPFAHEHDFAIVFMPVLVVLRRTRGAAWLAAAFGSLAVGVDWLGLAQRPSGSTATALLACGGALALTTLVRDVRPYHFAPLLVVPAVALAGAFALGHQLPVWPDPLPRDYRVAATLSAAALWYDEQRRSGTDVLDPAWGALRAISLCGCAALYAVATFALAEPQRINTSRSNRT